MKRNLQKLESTWHHPYALVHMDPLLTYILLSVPLIFALSYGPFLKSEKKCPADEINIYSEKTIYQSLKGGSSGKKITKRYYFSINGSLKFRGGGRERGKEKFGSKQRSRLQAKYGHSPVVET